MYNGQRNYSYDPNQRSQRRGVSKPRRKIRKAPPVFKCAVALVGTGLKLDYDEANKVLFTEPATNYHVFPSRTKAKRAIWRTVMASGIPMFHKHLVIVLED